MRNAKAYQFITVLCCAGFQEGTTSSVFLVRDLVCNLK
jgi:hypothetical protein